MRLDFPTLAKAKKTNPMKVKAQTFKIHVLGNTAGKHTRAHTYIVVNKALSSDKSFG